MTPGRGDGAAADEGIGVLGIKLPLNVDNRPAVQRHVLLWRSLVQGFIERIVARPSNFARHFICTARLHHSQGVVDVVRACTRVLTHAQRRMIVLGSSRQFLPLF